MPNPRRLLLILCSAALSCAVMGSFAAQAQNKLIVNNPDDREDSIPTAWWINSHQTPQDITNTINTLNARAIDISVEQFSPSYLFTVTYVQNAGPYHKGWSYYFDIDATTLANNLSANNARLISLKAYDIGGGQIRFAAIMVSNTGMDNKAWWWYSGITVSQITSLLATNNARLVQIHSYVTNGQTVYAVVMISNTGTDAKAWWWYTDTPSSQITSLALTNNARVIDLDYIPSDGYYNAIMVSCTGGCPAWSAYYGQTGSQMLALATANGARVIDANSYPGCGDLCFSFVLIDNSLPPLDSSNPITSRVGQLLRAGGVTGVQGLYLKAVGGPVLANLEDSFVYEPASSIKVLAHLYSMTQVQNGSATLGTPVTHYTNGPASCPDPATPSGTEPLSTALQEMMWHSDNARTREITDTFGDPNINSFATSIGMLNTRINQIIGCGGPIPDQLTLDDAGVLYEGVANGSRLTVSNRAIFYSLMAGKSQFQAQGYDWTHLWDTDIPNIIAQSTPAATAAQRQAYLNQMNLAYKAGGYTLCDASCTNVAEYLSITGVAEIPFCSGPSTALRDYVFGIYLHGALDSSWFSGKTTVVDTNFTAAKAETLREQIVTGLASCGLASVSVTVTSGNNQSAAVNTAFAPLVVTIKDANNNPVPNAVVTFSAPATGASGTFAAPCSGNTCNVTANASGVATAPTFTANGLAASYSVTAALNTRSVPFSLTNLGSVATGPPFGHIDTPINGSLGQAGDIGFTGWALSAATIANVALCREVLPGEPGINGLVYLGNAVLVPGVRPDVATTYPGYPNNNWGWGAQILTNELPGTNSQPLGNGSYKLHAIATDTQAPAPFHDSRDCGCAQSSCTDLGITTIAVNNAASILPFGTIDTPAQGETVSGKDYVNFGWVLTPQPNIVPIDGSTITVYIDNIAVGHPTYNQFRSDIASLFPGLKNSGGGVGFFHIDTTKLSNGIHNIGWGVTDNVGNAGGIGSRNFFVKN